LAVCGALAAFIGAYTVIHLGSTPPGGGPAFWVQMLPGRLAECGAWLAFGGLVSVLETLARACVDGVAWVARRRAVGLLVGILALAALRLGLEALVRWVPAKGWLVLDPQSLVAGTAIPLAFVLGLEARAIGAWGDGWRSARLQARLTEWGRRTLSATFQRP
jgi:hypothetical protein